MTCSPTARETLLRSFVTSPSAATSVLKGRALQLPVPTPRPPHRPTLPPSHLPQHRRLRLRPRPLPAQHLVQFPQPRMLRLQRHQLPGRPPQARRLPGLRQRVHQLVRRQRLDPRLLRLRPPQRQLLVPRPP